jgi:hypothetical protein
MAYFGMDFLGGSKTKVGKAEMGSQYSSGFARGEQEAFGDVGSARATGEEQRRLAEALRAQAEGRTPSLAAMQYTSALEQSQAAAASQLASARGLSPAQAQRLLMTQQSAARAGAAGQSAMMRLQEQQAAQGALANVLAQQRQQALLGASTASGIGAQAGQLGLAQQQMEQQRLIAEQQIRRQEEAAMEAGVTGALQSGTKAGLAFAGKTASKGGEIKGRSQYNGDTRSNDTVPALLSPGEIVLPRSVAQDEDAPEKSKKFVEAIKKQKKPAGKASIAAALARIQELEARLNAMEALADLEAEEQG